MPHHQKVSKFLNTKRKRGSKVVDLEKKTIPPNHRRTFNCVIAKFINLQVLQYIKSFFVYFIVYLVLLSIS